MVKRQKAQKLHEAPNTMPVTVQRLVPIPNNSEYTAADMRHFRILLVRMRDELVEEIQAARETPPVILYGHSVVLLQELRAVESALYRLDEGRYGICSTYGSRIERGRLEAIPSTHLCVGCKQGKRGEHTYGSAYPQRSTEPPHAA